MNAADSIDRRLLTAVFGHLAKREHRESHSFWRLGLGPMHSRIPNLLAVTQAAPQLY